MCGQWSQSQCDPILAEILSGSCSRWILHSSQREVGVVTSLRPCRKAPKIKEQTFSTSTWFTRTSKVMFSRLFVLGRGDLR